jgi:hypothetical protein
MPGDELHVIRETAEHLLAHDPAPVVRHRLLRDVLQRPETDRERIEARRGLDQSRWVQELANEQWEDGSWGRLHSKESAAGQKIGTTEVGVERGLALGLDAGHPILVNAAAHLSDILQARVSCRDRPEKNDRWPTGVQLFAAATLARINPEDEVLDQAWSLWLTIVERCFAGGDYDPEAESQAHRELTGASVKGSYLIINNKYALALLSARPGSIPLNVEFGLLNWLWHKQDGIGYLGQTLTSAPDLRKPGALDRWFSSLELLSRFAGWRSVAREAIAWLWRQQRSDGTWDFGKRPAASTMLPMSENWRKKRARAMDWTTRVLLLLARYHRA